MFYRFLNWLYFLVFIYFILLFTYINISSESFVFAIEVIYLLILSLILKSFYNLSLNILFLYKNYIKIHYEHLYITSVILKKLNIKNCAIYRCFQ